MGAARYTIVLEILHSLSLLNLERLEINSLHVMRGEKNVLSGISLRVDKGEIYALLGGNGAGKSTSLLSVLGFLSPESGEVYVNGLDVTKNLKETRASIAYLPEAANLYQHLNAYENLDYFLKLARVNCSREKKQRVLDQVSLDKEMRNHKLRKYSKGMRQKVALALAILRDTEILLLDEPTSGLDPVAIDEFHQLLIYLAKKGKTILMVTHDVYGACYVADKIGLLKDGRLVDEFKAGGSGRINAELVHRSFTNQRSFV